MAVRKVRVGFQVAADQREMRREDVRQHQIAEVVQQPGEVAQARLWTLLAGDGAGQPFDHRGGVDRLLPVGRGVLRLVVRQADGLAQRQAEGEVDHQVEAEHADNGVFHRADAPGSGVVGRGGPADHLRRQCRVGFHHAGDVVDRGFRVDSQLDDLLRRMRQRRNLDGFFQTLLDAPRSEALHGLGDFRTVVVRAVQVRPDVAQRHGEVAGAGLAQQALEVGAGDFHQQAGLTGLDQQPRLLQQAFFVQAGRAGQRRQAGQAAQLVLGEHARQSLRLDRRQLAAGELGQAREIEQMVLREQHQHGADAVIQQHCLDPLGRRNVGAVALDLVVHTEVFQQLGDQQGQFGAAFGVDSSIHKRTCCSDLPEYSEAVTRGRCGDGWLSYLAVFLAVTQPALEQWADVLRPACQQCLGGVAHRR